ncbi:MAG: serine/threonine protein kinase, partial [Acidobacteriota bacterium]|nr:serine/threonine protein kinase [Acidobacteriota bacterium]
MQTTADRMLGRYRLIGLLGRGGMADVYRAEDTRLDRIVAVKVIQSSYANDPAFLERFLREARIVAALDHPGILKIFDYGDDEGRPFLVMPHVTGGTLDSLRGPDALPADQVSRWIGQVADALDCAHARGVLHRDVKPGNVLIGSDGQAVLADFGIAKSAGASVSLTETGMVMGTPAYMAPELARGQPASRSTDLYALAAMTYELLTGRQPFIGENPLSVLHQHVTRPVPSVATTAPCLPRTLDRFFERAMAKDPALRPESGRALASGLAAATGDAKGISPGVSTRPMAGSLRAGAPLPEPGDPSRGFSRGSQASAAAAAKARRRGRPFTIVALVALAAMAVLFTVDRFFSPALPHEDP